MGWKFIPAAKERHPHHDETADTHSSRAVAASHIPMGLDPHSAGRGTDLHPRADFLSASPMVELVHGLFCKPAPAHSHILLFLCACAGRWEMSTASPSAWGG